MKNFFKADRQKSPALHWATAYAGATNSVVTNNDNADPYPIMNPILTSSRITTPLGDMLALFSQHGLCLLEFTDYARLPVAVHAVEQALGSTAIAQTTDPSRRLQHELDEYFARRRNRFTIPLDLIGTPFQKTIWQALLAVPYGTTRSYREQARQCGKPTAIRAVAAANGSNKIAIIVPCHRIIGSNGSLTGYAGGLARKQALLTLEQAV